MRFERSSSGAAAARPEEVSLFHAAWLFRSGHCCHTLAVAAARDAPVFSYSCRDSLLCGSISRAEWHLASAFNPLAPAGYVVWPHGTSACARTPNRDLVRRTDAAVGGTVIDVGPIRGEAEMNINDDGCTMPPLQPIDVRVRSLEEVSDTVDQQVPASGAVRLTVRSSAGTAAAKAKHVFSNAAILCAPKHAMQGEQGLESTLLKVGQHGSTSSTTPEFLSRVAPRFAVISCGVRKRYGHPRQEILELQEAQVRTFRTDTNGVSCFELVGRTVTARPDCSLRSQAN